MKKRTLHIAVIAALTILGLTAMSQAAVIGLTGDLANSTTPLLGSVGNLTSDGFAYNPASPTSPYPVLTTDWFHGTAGADDVIAFNFDDNYDNIFVDVYGRDGSDNAEYRDDDFDVVFYFEGAVVEAISTSILPADNWHTRVTASAGTVADSVRLVDNRLPSGNPDPLDNAFTLTEVRANGVVAIPEVLITVSGADNVDPALATQGGTSDLGTLTQTVNAATSTTGWQSMQYTITGLDLNGVGGTNDSVVVNLQVDAKRVDLRTGFGPMSDAGSTCNSVGEGIDLEFVSMAVNIDGGTNNGIGTFEGFTGVTLGKFEVIGESATVNGSVYTAQDINLTERIALTNEVAIDYAFASGGGSRLESFDFQVTAIPDPTPSVVLELASMFSDDMILQREKAVPVWGTSEPGAAITVEFAGQTNTTTAAGDGTWRVDLDSMVASAVSRTLTITAELDGFVTSQVSFTNVLVGEVWLCSGQSNMWWPNVKCQNDLKAIVAATPDDPLLRFFKIPKLSESNAVERLDAIWTESTTGTTGTAYDFSGVAYYFGLKLKAELGIPVGLIQCAKGGTAVEEWLPVVNDYNSTAGGCYNGMVDAIVAFAMRGVIWYQGEQNVMYDGYDGQPLTYVEKKKALINGWRALWGDEFPFYYVQLAPYNYTANDYTTIDDGFLPFFWEAQSAILGEVANTGMAVITDEVTEPNGSTNLTQIHPKNKEVPGTRLALLALDNTYGQDIVSTGPVFQSLETVGNTLEVTFDSADGLTTSDGLAPDWFELEVADGIYTSATAIVSNNMVIISAPAVTVPTGMRFAWNELAQPNLRNSAGLVASSFRAESNLFGQWTVAFGLSGSNALHGANPDGDTLDNLAEYALGGNPTNGSDRGHVPLFGTSEENGTNYFEYVYTRRRDAASRSLEYTVKATTNLVSGVWSTNDVTETEGEAIDSDFESVTNRVPLGVEGYMRLIIEFGE